MWKKVIYRGREWHVKITGLEYSGPFNDCANYTIKLYDRRKFPRTKLYEREVIFCRSIKNRVPAIIDSYLLTVNPKLLDDFKEWDGVIEG